MFWSANYITTKELNCILKEENVKLTQVLEADDILQECKADNKNLIQFLTRPDILLELIGLITEEPSKDVELTAQYRHANLACEVLTSYLSGLSDHIIGDNAAMDKLCDFLNQEPPLNPLLASYFSKTIEVLLEEKPSQDWCLYRIVCLRMLEQLRARRDFIPSLLRHMSTSAIADIFKYFIRLEDFFENVVVEWLEEHNFLDSLILIICGFYVSEESKASDADQEPNEADDGEPKVNGETPNGEPQDNKDKAKELLQSRLRSVEAANAAALLCDVINTGCSIDGYPSWAGVSVWACGGACSRAGPLLAHMFTSAPQHRRAALTHGATLLHTMLAHPQWSRGGWRGGVELALAPHLPLLHQALLQPPAPGPEGRPQAAGVGAARLAVARLLATLAASQLPEVRDTMLTLGTPGVLVQLFFAHPNNNFIHAELLAFVGTALGNPPFAHRFLAHLVMECDLLTRLMQVFEQNENIKKSGGVRAGYMGHVILLLNILRRVLASPDHYLPNEQNDQPNEQNTQQNAQNTQNAQPSQPEGNNRPTDQEMEKESSPEKETEVNEQAREEAREPIEYDVQRWEKFCTEKLDPVLLKHNTPLGGCYPTDNDYEAEAEEDEDFLQVKDFLKTQQITDCDTWEAENNESCPFKPSARGLFSQTSPWDLSNDENSEESNEDWAQFTDEANDPFSISNLDPNGDISTKQDDFGEFVDAFHGPNTSGKEADGAADKEAVGKEFPTFWNYSGSSAEGGGDANVSEMSQNMQTLNMENKMDEASTAELANNLLTAMSSMTPDAMANIVNSNIVNSNIDNSNIDNSNVNNSNVTVENETHVEKETGETSPSETSETRISTSDPVSTAEPAITDPISTTDPVSTSDPSER